MRTDQEPQVSSGCAGTNEDSRAGGQEGGSGVRRRWDERWVRGRESIDLVGWAVR